MNHDYTILTCPSYRKWSFDDDDECSPKARSIEASSKHSRVSKTGEINTGR